MYIGQSKKINHEIRQIKTPGSLANRPNLKNYFDASGLQNVKFYALSHGPEFEDRQIRLREEDKFIKKAGSHSINIVGNIAPKAITRFSSDPNVIDPIFIKRTTPWQKDPLGDLSNSRINFPILSENTTQGCLYIIKNKKTGNFYIGQSENSKILLRIHKHRSLIRKTPYWQFRGVKTSESITYEKMVSDIKQGGNIFEYAIFEYLDDFNTRERIDRQINVIAEALYLYGPRVYNNRTPKIQKILSKFRELGRTFNTTERKQKLLSYYERDPEQVAKYKKINYPVIVDGKYYDSLTEAGKSIKVPRQTVTHRCNSVAFPNYIYLNDTKNKIIPNSP